MFEVGRTYKITVSDYADQISYSADVIEVDLPLVKLDRVGNYEILNTHSPCFVSAVPNDDKAQADEQAAHREFLESFGSKEDREL